MKKYIAIVMICLIWLSSAACGIEARGGENSGAAQKQEAVVTDRSFEIEAGQKTDHTEQGQLEEDNMNQIYIKVGQNTLTATLADNESAKALKELLADGPLTISASNYGGFEKVCSLGTELPRNDSQTTTQAGDICLYNGSQIVIFYGSNSWAYTRLGSIDGVDSHDLEKVLSGSETEITLSLNQ